jgi:hypothetical protein
MPLLEDQVVTCWTPRLRVPKDLDMYCGSNTGYADQDSRIFRTPQDVYGIAYSNKHDRTNP